MASDGRPEGSPDFDGNETPLYLHQGRLSLLDNKTLMETPAPLAASSPSTMARMSRKADRVQQLRGQTGVVGSFIDEAGGGQASSLPNVEDMSLVKMSYGSMEEQSKSKNSLAPPQATNGDMSVSTRSSFGLLPLDQMEDLSSSILHYKSSTEGASVATENSEPSSHDPSPFSLPRTSASDSKHSDSQSTASTLQASTQSQQTVNSTVTATATSSGKTQGMNLGEPPGVQQVLGGLLFTPPAEGDQDVSVHEVEFDQNELEQFNDEFSDFGDTITEEPDGSPQGPPQAVPQMSLFSQAHPPEMQFSMLEAESADAFDTLDVDVDERPEAAGQNSPVDFGMMGQQGDGQEADSIPFQQSLGILDSRYLRQDPDFGVDASAYHQAGDGHESGDQDDHPGISGDIPEADMLTSPGGFQGQDFRALLTAQRDGESDNGGNDFAGEENEVAARDTLFLDQTEDNDDQPESERFSAEGHSLLQDPEYRQSGEGDVSASPVPGDGGGGGDGSSGHGSEESSPQMSETEGPSATGSTFNVLRGLGFVPSREAPYNPFEEDNPEAQQRIAPMGDDLLPDSAPERHVRFASPAAVHRAMTASGPSLDTTEDSIMRGTDILMGDFSAREEDSQREEESRLASQFFTPSAALAGSQASEGSCAPAFENSTFNLADLCPKGEGAADDSIFAVCGPPDFDEDQDGFSSAESGDKHFVDEESPVYINEEGEGVTDLAYRAPLPDIAGNPFESMGSDSGPPVDLGIVESGKEDQFVPGDQCLEMIDNAEQVFQEEHAFSQDEVIDPSPMSLTLPDSWSQPSQSMMSPPSWFSSQEQASAAYMRISIGTLIGAKTEVLGSLEGHDGAQRPTFGSEFTTPPRDRQPATLLDSTMGQSQNGNELTPTSSQQQCRDDNYDAPAGDAHYGDDERDVATSGIPHRESGVGESVEVEAAADTTLVMDDLGKNSPPDAVSHDAFDLDLENERHSPEPNLIPQGADNVSDAESSRPSSQASHASSEDSYASDRSTCRDDSSISNKTGVLSISAITEFISTASAESKSQNLTSMIMKMSQSRKHQQSQHKKVSSKHRVSASKSGRKPLDSLENNNHEGKEEKPSVKPSKAKPDTSRRQSGNGSTASFDTRKKIPIATKQSSDEDRVRKPASESNRRGSQQTTKPANSQAASGSGSQRGSISKPTASSSSARQSQYNGGGPGSKPRQSDASKLPASKPAGSLPPKSVGGRESARQSRAEPNRSSQAHTGANSRVSNQKRLSGIPSRTSSSGKSGQPKNVKDNSTKPPVKPSEQTAGQSKASSCQVSDQQRKSTDREITATEDAAAAKSRSSQGCEDPRKSARPEFSQKAASQEAESFNKVDRFLTQDTNFRSPRLSTIPGRYSQLDRSQRPSFDFSENNLECDQFTPAKRSDRMIEKPTNRTPESPNDRKPTDPEGHDPNVCTPNEKPCKVGHKRLSSTPNVADAENFTICTSHCISHISPSPRDRVTYFPSAEATVNSDGSNKSTPVGNNNQVTSAPHIVFQQSTPKPNENTADLGYYRSRKPSDNVLCIPAGDISTNASQCSLLSQYPVDNSELHTPHSPNSAKNDFHFAFKGHLPAVPENPPDSLSSCLDVPHELRLPDDCCVWLSCQTVLSIRSRSSKWLRVSLTMVAVTADGKQCDTTAFCPFVMKEKTFLEPHAVEEVQVIFSPHQAGTYVGQLHLLPTPIGSESLPEDQLVPTMVTLQAVAHEPKIEVVAGSSKSTDVLDFGAVSWGYRGGLPILLFNRGRCSVPVRLRILSGQTASQNCFSFEKHASNVPSILNLTLPPHSGGGPVAPANAVVWFRAPSRQADNACSSAPEEFTANVEVEVDTPSSFSSLGMVHLHAAVGTARLHAPAHPQVINLESAVGKCSVRTIPLRNAGNIPLDLLLEITHWPDFFTVNPRHLSIPPGGQMSVTVSFLPKSLSAKFDSLLLVRVEPNGPDYEIDLCGQVEQAPDPVIAKPMSLLSSKQKLAFGGVALGKETVQSVTLKSPAEETVKLTLKISGHCRDFHLLTHYSSQEKVTKNKEIILRPLEEFPVNVMFTPTRAAAMEGKLYIYSSHSDVKSTIRLQGYGGVSRLELQGVKSGNKDSYWSNIGVMTPGHSKVTQVKLINTGSRAAFVKAVPFRDLGLKTIMDSSSVEVQPNEFCIQSKNSVTITVILSVTETEAAVCRQEAALVSVCAIFYGDEVCRQKMREALHKPGQQTCGLHQAVPVRDIDFDVPFLNEDLVTEGQDIASSSEDIDNFYLSLSKLTLSLVGEPPVFATPRPTGMKNRREDLAVTAPASWNIVNGAGIRSGEVHAQTWTNPQEFDSQRKTQYTRRAHSLPSTGSPLPYTETAGHSPSNLTPSRRSLPLQQSSAEVGKPPDGMLWCLCPERLILEAPSRDTGVLTKKMLQIINYKEIPVRFEVSKPSHVTVFPECGIIKQMSSVGLSISANHKVLDHHTDLPYRGNLLVSCGDQQKVLPIQIREDMVSLDQSLRQSSDHLSPRAATGSGPHITVAMANRRSATRLSVLHQEVDFPPTAVGKTSQLPLELTNIRPFPIKWTASSIAPAYLRIDDRDKTVHRVPYSAFSMFLLSGILQAREELKILVTFSPREIGCYSQGWEIKSEAVAGDFNTRSHSCQLYLTGQGEPLTAVNSRDFTTCITSSQLVSALDRAALSATVGQQTLPPQLANTAPVRRQATEKKGRVIVKQESLIFPPTTVHDKHTCKVQVKNKDSCLHEVFIESVDLPFCVKRSHFPLKSQHYARLPVEFHPRQIRQYTGTLTLRADDGSVMEVKLFGIAQ